MPMILVLDDSATMVMSLTHILKGAGYDVETGMNGREGITKITDGAKPSVILTDLNMPELDGIGFIKEPAPGGRQTTLPGQVNEGLNAPWRQ